MALSEPGLLLGILLGVPVLLFLYILHYVSSIHTRTVDGAKVPSGNYWLFPLVGETIQALSVPPREFLFQQSRKYGATFLTHFIGNPTILTSDLEMSKWIYAQTNKLFSNAVPRTTNKLLGEESVFFMEGELHKKLRNLLKGPLSITELLGFIPTVDKAASVVMASWKGQKSVRVYHEAKKYVLYIAWAYLINIDTQSYPFMDQMLADIPGATQAEKLAHLYFVTQSGMMAVPLRVPGTSYYKAMSARARIQEILKKVVADRRSGKVECKDLLQSMLLPMEDGSLLTDKQIMDNLFTLLGASDVTTSTCLVWMIKWIYENPKVYEDLKVELDAIKNSKPEGEPLTHEDIKKMTLTLWTMNETLRLVQVVGWITARFANQDLKFKDVAIPKNWKVGITHEYHHDPTYFPEPEKFNPYRFEKPPPPFTYTPFGAGVRTCPGKELAKIEICSFVYHMITTYSWVPAEPEEGTKWHQFPHPKNLLPVYITPR